MNRNDKDFIVQKIRTEYMEKSNEVKELDALKALDAKVKKPANVFAYIFGSVSALIMGAGMSLTMTDIGTQLGISNTMPIGIVIGVAGLAMAVINYPVYRKLLASRKEKYADEILKMSEKLIKQ
ncbi:MAG: dihydropteridine reductase [Oscillospiraceae bacterium]|nr:dihydropteridine reductase [Oscillospiraceae bacterium]